jgi:SPP1 family predicted phage head-tail adaptor
MRAGVLRNRLTFQTRTKTQDTFGAEAVTPWADAFTLWGSVEPILGREYIALRQQQVDVTHRVRVRRRAGIKEAMRIKIDMDSRDPLYLHIESIIEPYIRGIEVQLMCREYRDQ